MIARAESGQARDNMIEFDAAEIVRGVGELYEPLADEKGLTLRVEAAEAATVQRQPRAGQPGARQSGRQRDQICGAERRERRRRAPPRSCVGARRRGRRVLLTVADRGPGIPEADRGRVVERFVRLRAEPLAAGLGLGLSLAAAVARLHGGELEAGGQCAGPEVVISCRV